MPAPSASSTLVNVAEDAEIRLVRLLAESNRQGVAPTFVPECEASIVNGDAAQLLRTILAQPGSMDTLLRVEDAPSVFSLLAALIDKSPQHAKAGLVQELSLAVVHAANTSSSAATAAASMNNNSNDDDDTNKNSNIHSKLDVLVPIAVLSTLYNMRWDPLEKVQLLVHMITLATIQNATHLLEPPHVLGKILEPPRIAQLLDSWQVPWTQRRPLYQAAAQGIATRSPMKQQRFLLLLVQTYSTQQVRNKQSKTKKAVWEC